MAAKGKGAGWYRVRWGTSVRESADRADPGWGIFRNFYPGDYVPAASVPPHAALAEWLAAGYWEPSDPPPAAGATAAQGEAAGAG